MPPAAAPGPHAHPAPGPASDAAEPAIVDPAVAARKREEARIRGAEMAAWQEERRRRRRLIAFGVLAAAAGGVALWWYLF